MPPRVESRNARFAVVVARASSRPRNATFSGPAAAIAASVAETRDAANVGPDFSTSGCCSRIFVKGSTPLFATVFLFSLILGFVRVARGPDHSH